ncbi:hypothetical protein ACHWQZ_G019685 [Mnemiopsis leidyi]
MDENGDEGEITKKEDPMIEFDKESGRNTLRPAEGDQEQSVRFQQDTSGDCFTASDVQADRIINCPNIEDKGPSPIKNAKPLDLYSNLSASAYSDTSSVLSPASSSENYNEPLNLSTDMECTDSETETRHSVCSTLAARDPAGSKALPPSFSPQRNLQQISPLHLSAGYSGQSPTRSILPEGFSENISTMLPTSSVRVKVRSRHASFSTPPKSPADSQWRLFKVTKDMKGETYDDIDGERNFTQSLTLKNACDSKLSVTEREEGGWSCPDSPVRCLTSPGGRSQPPVSPARQRLPSPTFPTRCVSPNSFSRTNSFTLKRKLVDQEHFSLKRKLVEYECASPPKRPCAIGLGHRSPTVEYRTRNHSPAPLSPLAVSSCSATEGDIAAREVPIHLLDRIELDRENANSSDSSSSDSPPRVNRHR